ncbi:SDR family NAD(P)-dependent oxidoreductase [Massilia endophytica]|uniref:SDR family NAD(P)-dependent oxidoreductase n=1 Tax=Massilia endophytica TaxID=2899220 RepID=UPI001E372379|nr:SDR family oxidoreductase [Massilia endophytica]UGQ49139.1 SDR family oxidoreductase [Massilia endophytica]
MGEHSQQLMSGAEAAELAGSAQYPSLRSKRVFVTGGGSGIGADIVSAFVKQGAHVAFADRDAAASRSLLAALEGTGKQAFFVEADLADIKALRGAVQAAADHFGDIDILINNTANDARHAFLDVESDGFDALMTINLKTAFFAAQAVMPGMLRRGGGSIVNLGSTGWKNKVAGYPVYAACKSAVNGLTRSLAREYGKHNVRVNTLTPGWVMTPKQLAQWVDAEGEAEMDRNQCLPGRILGSDIASMALFLASTESRMITAQEFVVDAGWT